MNYTTSIQSVVMRRVHMMHVLRPLLSGMTASIIIFVVALWAIGREVWVAKVFHNMPSITDVQAVLLFYMNAFLETRHPVVQALILLVLATGIWFVYSTIKSLKIATSFGQLAGS